MPRWTEEEFDAWLKLGRKCRNEIERLNDSHKDWVKKHTVPPGAIGLKRDGSLNKLERQFQSQLEDWKLTGLIRWYVAKPHSLKISENCWFKPDFLIWWRLVEALDAIEMDRFDTDDTCLQVVDVKGFWRDDARVKVKACAEIYPCYLFSGVQWDKKTASWKWEHF